MQRRIELIESDRFIRLLERPEYKRRWATEPWDKQVERALRGWLLDRLEDRRFWFDAQGRPDAEVGRPARRPGVAATPTWCRCWSCGPGARTSRRRRRRWPRCWPTRRCRSWRRTGYKDSGLRKREAWEQTWDLQRREDAGEKVGDDPGAAEVHAAPTSGRPSWWQHRGKLDVPKERFILYPDAGRETDPTALLGWAGWDHAQQALALATIISEREAEGWADERLVPLVAGLAELQPWVQQWHDEIDPAYGVNLADFCAEQLRDRAVQVRHDRRRAPAPGDPPRPPAAAGPRRETT